MAGCNQEAKTEPPLPRPVRTVTVEKGEVGDAVQLTGDIRAENEVNLAFRIGGRIIERKGEVGDKVEPDQVLAKLDPQDELNTLRSAQAALNAARGQEVEAQNNFDRQNHLMERGFTTRAIFDSAKQALQTAQARVDDATAQLDIAQDRVSFTELKANVEGTITARSAEAGRGGAGGTADLHRRAAGRARRRVRRPGPGLERRAAGCDRSPSRSPTIPR